MIFVSPNRKTKKKSLVHSVQQCINLDASREVFFLKTPYVNLHGNINMSSFHFSPFQTMKIIHFFTFDFMLLLTSMKPIYQIWYFFSLKIPWKWNNFDDVGLSPSFIQIETLKLHKKTKWKSGKNGNFDRGLRNLFQKCPTITFLNCLKRRV